MQPGGLRERVESSSKHALEKVDVKNPEQLLIP